MVQTGMVIEAIDKTSAPLCGKFSPRWLHNANNKTEFSILLVFTIFLSTCGLYGNAQQKQEQQQVTPDTQHVRTTGVVDYEPAVVELKGKLIIRTYFGPPNFGENPETDAKEETRILSLDEPINVGRRTDSDAGFDSAPVENVKELQLVWPKSLKDLFGKAVVVKGTLFPAKTGHHHTDVLMDVQSIGLFRGPASETAYVGCWTGMGGGRLRITSNRIRDIGSGEESSYKELPISKRQEKVGLQTGEEYLFEADNNFRKSFLAKFIRFSYNSDQTVGIGTYDSYDDYMQDKYKGQGLFQKAACRRTPPKDATVGQCENRRNARLTPFVLLTRKW